MHSIFSKKGCIFHQTSCVLFWRARQSGAPLCTGKWLNWAVLAKWPASFPLKSTNVRFRQKWRTNQRGCSVEVAFASHKRALFRHFSSWEFNIRRAIMNSAYFALGFARPTEWIITTPNEYLEKSRGGGGDVSKQPSSPQGLRAHWEHDTFKSLQTKAKTHSINTFKQRLFGSWPLSRPELRPWDRTWTPACVLQAQGLIRANNGSKYLRWYEMNILCIL